MQSLALIVNAERALNATLSNYLGASTDIECMPFTSEVSAIEWLQRNGRKVDVVFASWKVSWNNDAFLDTLRRNEHTRDALVYIVLSAEEQEAIKGIFGASELIDHLLVKPFRARELVKRIQRVLRGAVVPDAHAMIVDEDGNAREIVRDVLGSLGFGTIDEMPTGQQALQHLRASPHEYSLVVSTWEMNGDKDFQLQRQLRQSPRFAAIPLIMVTSQSTIESVKFVQETATGVDGFLLAPFEPKSLRAQVDNIAAAVATEQIARMAESEARRLGDGGDRANELACLQRAVEKIPSCAFLFEALGAHLRHEKNDLSASIAAYEKAVKLHPYRADLITKLTEVFAASGKPEEVIRVTKAYLYRLGFDERLRMELAKTYLQTGDYGAACVELRRLLNVNPLHGAAEALLQVATSLEEKKQTEAARKAAA